MSLKHYYIEDVSVDPMRNDRIKSVPSIQFNEIPESQNIFITIQGFDFKGKLIDCAVKVPLKEIENAVKWIKEK